VTAFEVFGIFICSIHPAINIILIFFFYKYKYYIDMCILKFWGVKKKGITGYQLVTSYWETNFETGRKKLVTRYPGPVTSFGIFIYPVITG
jgi:hypothetical protein